MRIVVLSAPTAWHFLDLKRAADQAHDVVSFRFEDLAASIAGDQPFNVAADCVIARTMSGGSLQQVVFRMDLLARLSAAGTLVLNPPKSIEAAVDKYLSLELLSQAGVPVPQTFVCQDVETALDHFKHLGRSAVLKPLFGSMGNGLVLLKSIDEAAREFEDRVASGDVIYQQRFVEHAGYDIRLLVIGEQVLAMKRVNPTNWITNISQGGIGEPHRPSAKETELAIRAARAVGAHFAGVDLVYELDTGQPYVLEVNAVPGWRAISKVLNVDVARAYLSEVERLLEFGVPTS